MRVYLFIGLIMKCVLYLCSVGIIIINKANFLLAVASQVKSQIILISDLIFYMLDFLGF